MCCVTVSSLLVLALPVGGLGLRAASEQDPCSEHRRRMVAETIEARGIDDPRVLAAMLEVKREQFMAPASCAEAYADSPSPIGAGQTISQPFVVAYMSAAVKPEPDEICLEIGTGSGYQAAVLAELCREVWSIEYHPELAAAAERNLRSQGYGEDRVTVKSGDGYGGWPERAPFDVIVVTAAPEKVPAPLLQQLAVGGRLIAPIGPTGGDQRLVLYRRKTAGDGDDVFERTELLGVRFVPFLGEAQQR
jgi:protein-L-isoaspartate(D-aspartate) O-methyltransferase